MQMVKTPPTKNCRYSSKPIEKSRRLGEHRMAKMPANLESYDYGKSTGSFPNRITDAAFLP